MLWQDVRERYPDQWIVIEALAARTVDQMRYLDNVAVAVICKDGIEAMQRYRRLHQEHPDREFYFVHTSREALEIHVQQWLGIRVGHADNVTG